MYIYFHTISHYSTLHTIVCVSVRVCVCVTIVYDMIDV